MDDILVNLVCENGDNTSRAMSVRGLIFAEVEYEEKKYILNNGLWGKYNIKFMEELNRQLDIIDEEYANYSKKEFCKSYKNEDDYISSILNDNKDLYLQMHTKTVQVNGVQVEIADLLDKETNELFAIKLGRDNAKLIYTFDQAMNSIQCIVNQKEYDLENKFLDKGFTADEVDSILLSKKSSVIIGLEQITYRESIASNTFKLKDLRSLLLKLKIVNWAQYAANSNIEFALYIIAGEKIEEDKEKKVDEKSA